MSHLRRFFGFVLVFSALAGVASADTPFDAVPEIDPGAAGAALTLISGGILILKDRFRTR